LPVGFIAISLGLNWVMMIYFGLRLHRYKAMLYPIMFIVNPFFNWVYMVYGIFTAGQRTWGGPRADAGAAGGETTVQEAIEKAEATGDDLNIIPETFKPAVQTQRRQTRKMTLLPSDAVLGRFAAAEELPNGWYNQNDSSANLPQDPSNPNQVRRRGSFDSFYSSSDVNSVYMPRRVESVMGDEDAQKYKMAQMAQREAGGRYMEHDAGQVYEMHDDIDKSAWTASAESVASGDYDQYGRPIHNHSRGNSDESNHNRPDSQERSPKKGRFPVAVPDQSTRQGANGRSPLARRSIGGTPNTQQEQGIEMQQQRQQDDSTSNSRRGRTGNPGGGQDQNRI
jgi:chitin synthase